LIAELVRQYDTLKRCGITISDPFFGKETVSVEIVLKQDRSFCVNWIGPVDNRRDKEGGQTGKKEISDDCGILVTEQSAGRTSSNDTPHALVDNVTWMFGELFGDKGRIRNAAYLRLLEEFCKASDGLSEVTQVLEFLKDKDRKEQLWLEVEKVLKKHIPTRTKDAWQKKAQKAYIRWVIEEIGSSGKPVHHLEHVQKAWIDYRENQIQWNVKSTITGGNRLRSARLMHPKVKGGVLVSFNEPSTQCGHLHSDYRKKQTPKGNEEDKSALPAQLSNEDVEKYTKALDWLVENQSLRFGDTTICTWVDQIDASNREIDTSAHRCIKAQSQKSAFSRSKAKKGKGKILADSGYLIESLRRFRNGQCGNYRDKRFLLLSIILKRTTGRHAIVGNFTGTMGELEDNADRFIASSTIRLPQGYLGFKDKPRDFCPTLMDILDSAGVKSQKKKRLVWNREVVEVIVHGDVLPPDLCRIVVLKAIQQKHREQSQKTCPAYRGLLAIAAGCARHYLNRILRKENYSMGLDTTITNSGYLAGRLFAVCERIQKRGRSWGATLSDKLFSASIERPLDTLGQLYQNCLCYDVYKKDSEWFEEIFDKIMLSENVEGNGVVMPAQGVDIFEFLLGYWHQRSKLYD